MLVPILLLFLPVNVRLLKYDTFIVFICGNYSYLPFNAQTGSAFVLYATRWPNIFLSLISKIHYGVKDRICIKITRGISQTLNCWSYAYLFGLSSFQLNHFTLFNRSTHFSFADHLSVSMSLCNQRRSLLVYPCLSCDLEHIFIVFLFYSKSYLLDI